MCVDDQSCGDDLHCASRILQYHCNKSKGHDVHCVKVMTYIVQASVAEVRSQPQPSPPGPSMHSVHSVGAQQPAQPFAFAPHCLTLLSPQLPPYQHQHTPHQHQGTPYQHSLTQTLSAEAESPGERQVYSLRSQAARRVPAEPISPDQTHDDPQRPVHKVHHFFTCHSDQVPLLLSNISQTLLCASLLRLLSSVRRLGLNALAQ